MNVVGGAGVDKWYNVQIYGGGSKEVDVLINYDLMNKMIPLGRRRRGGVTYKG